MIGARSFIVLALTASGSVYAQPRTIRVWGSAQMLELMEHWQKGFSRYHADVRFENHMNGAVSAIAGIYTGVADLALSREIWPTETLAFEQVLGYKPFAIEVATGSFDVPTKSDSLEIFVHRENPIAQLTLAQLEAVFGAQHPQTWGDLGLKGEWAKKAINAYGFKPENAGALFFSDIVMKGSRNWNCHLKSFANITGASGIRVDAGQLILDALSKDRYGIAISNAHYAQSKVKAVAVGLQDGGPFIEPTKDNVRNRTYPLTRVVLVFLNRAPGKPIEPKLSEFLRYILSNRGQDEVVAEGAYLPLPARIAQVQVARLQ
ncbi:MAG: substrate-binding domain-containing protein [Acidobacteriota bacterium]|nr:substrate-binding domain-containing protein [Acidobacteriota bacterium]